MMLQKGKTASPFAGQCFLLSSASAPPPPRPRFRRLDPGKVARRCQRLAGDEAASRWATLHDNNKMGQRDMEGGWQPRAHGFFQKRRIKGSLHDVCIRLINGGTLLLDWNNRYRIRSASEDSTSSNSNFWKPANRNKNAQGRGCQ